jgi:hypothetical protein
MNMFAFSYSALIAPIGLDVYRVSPILVGALAAAEPSRGGLRCSDRENRDDVVSYAYPHDTGVARVERSVECVHRREIRCGRLVPRAF